MPSISQNINSDELWSLLQRSRTFQEMTEIEKEVLVLKAFNTSEEGQSDLCEILGHEQELLRQFEQDQNQEKAQILKQYLSEVKHLLTSHENKQRQFFEEKDKAGELNDLDDLLAEL